MKRKSREKVSKTSLNLMEPIPFDKIGNADDVCFGKHYSPTAKECSNCGDSEICSIVFGQKLHAKRDKIESTQPFKDIKNNPSVFKWKKAYKLAKKIIKGKGGKVEIDLLEKKLKKKLGISSDNFKVILDKMAGKPTLFSIRNNQIRLR